MKKQPTAAKFVLDFSPPFTALTAFFYKSAFLISEPHTGT